MNNKFKWILGAAMLVALVMTVGYATVASAQGPTSTPPAPYTNPWGSGWGSGGMMGGWRGNYAPTQGYTSTVPYGYRGRGMGPGMMGGWGTYGYGYTPNANPISLDQAVTSAQQYVAALNNNDLALTQVEEYTANFYGVVKEESTGMGAVYPEPGPSMMWNTKYSPMAWMTDGFWFSAPSAQMPVTLAQARDNAEQYLKTYLPNTTVEDKGDTFYGYYNFDLLQNGTTYGMLSVNGYTGVVWYHTWHGNFVAAKQLD